MRASFLRPLTCAAIVPRCSPVAHSGHMQSSRVLANTRLAKHQRPEWHQKCKQGAATRVYLCAVRRGLCIPLADASAAGPGLARRGARARVGVFQRRPADRKCRYVTARPAATGGGEPVLRGGGARSGHAPTTRSAGPAVHADRQARGWQGAPCRARQRSPPARGARRRAAARARRIAPPGRCRGGLRRRTCAGALARASTARHAAAARALARPRARLRARAAAAPRPDSEQRERRQAVAATGARGARAYSPTALRTASRMRRSAPMRCVALSPILFRALFMAFTTISAAASHSTGTPSASPPAAGPAAAAAAPAARPPPAARVRGGGGIAPRAPAGPAAGAAAPAVCGPASCSCLARQAATRALRAAGRQPRTTVHACLVPGRKRATRGAHCGAPERRRACSSPSPARFWPQRPLLLRPPPWPLCPAAPCAWGAHAAWRGLRRRRAARQREHLSCAARGRSSRPPPARRAPCAPRGRRGPAAPVERGQRAPRGKHARPAPGLASLPGCQSLQHGTARHVYRQRCHCLGSKCRSRQACRKQLDARCAVRRSMTGKLSQKQTACVKQLDARCAARCSSAGKLPLEQTADHIQGLCGRGCGTLCLAQGARRPWQAAAPREVRTGSLRALPRRPPRRPAAPGALLTQAAARRRRAA
jgi:hypothetical protein